MGHQVKFYQLRCIETEDNGEDETWVDFRGGRVWGRGDVSKGDVINVNNGPFTLSNSGADVVSVWEHDDFDPDDHLGDFHISPAVSGRGEQVAVFRGDGAHYTLTYEVRPDNW